MLAVRSFCLVLAVVVLAVGTRAALPQINFYAPEAGTAICGLLPCLDPSTNYTTCYPQCSFFQTSTNKTTYLPFPADAPRQFVAQPFVYSGEDEVFIIRAIRIYFRPLYTVTSVNLTVFFYLANATNPQFPGATLPGTPALGQIVNFTKVSNQSADPTPVYDMIGFLPTELNITAGLYYVVVAGYNSSKTSANLLTNALVSWPVSANVSYYSFPAYNGLWMAYSTYTPFINQAPTNVWTTISGYKMCLWVDGATPTQIANTPPPWRVRFAIDDDLSNFSGPSFVATVGGILNATLAANGSYPLTPAVFDGVTARVVIVTTARTNTTDAQTFNVDFYISGPNTVALTNLAFNLDVPTLRNSGVLSQYAVPQQITYDHPLYSW